jgi:hypothetical protein
MTRLRPAWRPADRAARPAGMLVVLIPESKRARDFGRRARTIVARLQRPLLRILDAVTPPRIPWAFAFWV